MDAQLTSITLTLAEAKELTAQIKSGAEQVYEMLLRAHDGKAWQVMGFDSWRDYAVKEFEMSQRRAYYLLDHAKIQVEFSDCTMVQKPNERQSRHLSTLDTKAQRVEAMEKATELAASEGRDAPTARHVEAAVEEIKTGRPIVAPAITDAQQRQIDESENDSERLWLLKSYWKKASKKEREAFRVWIETH